MDKLAASKMPTEALRVFVRLHGAEVWQGTATRVWYGRCNVLHTPYAKSTEREILEQLHHELTTKTE